MSKQKTRVAIVGGGIMGTSLAYLLSKEGIAVTIYERGENLGGLATYLMYNDVRIDRFYHTILSSDMSMQAFIKETGVEDRLHFTATKQGFYDNGKLYPFNTPVDFMRFPPLNLFQRFRLGLQIIYAQLERNADKMDRMSVEKWLTRVSGQGVYKKVWKPLLRAKFDSEVVDVPATYIWSRLRRMMSTRQGVTSKEMMCYLENGYFTLIEALAKCCEQQGVSIHLNTPIEEIAIEDGQVTGVRTESGVESFDMVISTLQSPIFGSLIPKAPQAYRDLLAGQEYLGVLCPLLILKERLTPYYVLNITDESLPFTAVVETTNLIDPKHVGGYHLVYLPKYITPNNEMAKWPDEKIKTEWMRYFKQMFPDFDDSTIVEFLVQRARYVEPLRPMGTIDQIPTMETPVKNLYMGNTAMIYPELNNGEAVTTIARKIAKIILSQSESTLADAAASDEAVIASA